MSHRGPKALASERNQCKSREKIENSGPCSNLVFVLYFFLITLFAIYLFGCTKSWHVGSLVAGMWDLVP